MPPLYSLSFVLNQWVTFKLLQLEIQGLDMMLRLAYFVTHVWGQVAIIRKTVELLDYFVTSIVHVFPMGKYC